VTSPAWIPEWSRDCGFVLRWSRELHKLTFTLAKDVVDKTLVQCPTCASRSLEKHEDTLTLIHIARIL
jgi:hypothetical protein